MTGSSQQAGAAVGSLGVVLSRSVQRRAPAAIVSETDRSAHAPWDGKIAPHAGGAIDEISEKGGGLTSVRKCSAPEFAPAATARFG